MSPPVFTAPDAWGGGEFELLVHSGSRNEASARKLLAALWSAPVLDGVYLDADREPAEQPRLLPEQCGTDVLLYGVATMPNNRRVACRSCLVRDELGVWLYFGCPLGSLGTAYPVGAYPFHDGLPLDWIEPVSEWLQNIGQTLFVAFPFDFAVIGGCLDCWSHEELLTCKSGDVPAERLESYLIPDGGTLKCCPATRNEPPFYVWPFSDFISAESSGRNLRMRCCRTFSALVRLLVPLSRR